MRICIALFTFCLFFTACGGETTSGSNSTGSATLDEAMTKAEVALGTTSSGDLCLGQEGKSVCDFLDDELISKYLPEGAKEKSYKDMERGMLSSCSYSIDHSTKKISLKVGSSNMEVPATYQVALLSIESYDTAKKARQRFQRTYKTFSPAEAAEARKKLEEGIDAKLAKGEITKEQAEMSKGFGGVIGKASWESVSGIGDLAVWGNSMPDKEPETMGSLVVLSGDTYFTLNVDLLESRAHSQEAAVAIARSVLAACD